MPTQELLNLKLDDKKDFASFVYNDNQVAIEHVLACAQRRSHAFFYIYGRPDSGKSHLLNAFLLHFNTQQLQSILLDLRLALNLDPQLLSFEQPEILLLDNIDALCGLESWELELFTLYNRWQELEHGLLIVTADSSSDVLNFKRHDLTSRLKTAINIQLKPLNEAQCIQAVQFKAQQRGFKFETKAAAFLVQHSNRSLSHLVGLLDRLDKAGSQQLRPLTIPFIKKVLTL